MLDQTAQRLVRGSRRAQYYRQKYCKFLNRRGCFVTRHPLKNMNQLIMIRGRTVKVSASSRGNETVVWKICSYQVPAMVGTNASTKEKHNLTCSSPRRTVRSHSLVCSENPFSIVGIGPIPVKEL